MEIIFKGRQTEVAARFRDLATAKLERLEKLDQKTIRVDVEVSVERNPRLASQKERVELTIVSRGPAIRAEAAAEDRFAALDLALAKLDSRLRRALDRRKRHYLGHGLERVAGRLAPEQLSPPAESKPSDQSGIPEQAASAVANSVPRQSAPPGRATGAAGGQGDLPSDSVVPIEMEGDGPLVVRQKFHHAVPIPIDQALLEMELVGHDFYLFHDIDEDMPSVVYRRHGYQYGVIRLVERAAAGGSQLGPASADAGAGIPPRRRPDRANGSRPMASWAPGMGPA
jgi:ribosomal subunit interface protein